MADETPQLAMAELMGATLRLALVTRIELATLKEYLIETNVVVDSERYKTIRRTQSEKVVADLADDSRLGQAARDALEDFKTAFP